MPTTRRRIEVFRAGTFQAMDGRSYAFSAADVAAIAAAYDVGAAPAPVVVGHPSHDDPAFGWASAFEVDDRGVLVAELDNLAPAFVAAVAEGRYRKVSMKFFGPDAPNNPKPGQYYPRHVGFLGGAAPAVAGLAPVEFAGDDTGTVEIELAAPELSFTDYGHKDTAKVLRNLRDWIIEKFGLEDADKAIDSWYIDWIDDAADADKAGGAGFAAPKPAPRRAPPVSPPLPANAPTPPITFAAPIDPAASPADNPETQMTNETLAAREAQLNARAERLAQDENAAFADTLISGGHVAAGSRDRLIALLGMIPVDAEAVAFAEGGKDQSVNPRDLLKDLLVAAPTALHEGQVIPDEEVRRSAPSFAAPAGYDVEADGLDLHARATAYQAKNPNVSFVDAAIAVQNQEA